MDKPKPGLPTTEIYGMDLPIIADLGDGWYLVAHPNGVGIGTADGLAAMSLTAIPESVRAAAVEAFEKLAWPLVRDQFYPPTGKYTRPADLPGRVCRVLQAYTMYEMTPENGSLSDLVYRLTHVASGRCPHEGWMDEFEKLEEDMEEAAYTSPAERKRRDIHSNHKGN